ncbi:MAG: M20 family metallopeptidase [Candidatus Bipolaricaulia bacterium]
MPDMAAQDDLDRVLAAIDRDELVKLTQQLIQIKSVIEPQNEDGTEARAAELVRETLDNMGMAVAMDEAAPDRPNVVGRVDGSTPGPCVLLEGHTDVVTEGDRDTWTVDPFGGEIADGRIYGRGACDTKGNLAAAIVAIKAILDAGVDFPGSIVMVSPVDEEGMMIGIKRFIEAGWADDVDAAIICEPENNELGIAQKGALRARLTTEGKMSHGAMPLAGVNPVPSMGAVLRRAHKLERREIQRHGMDELLGFPSLTPTVVRGPVKGEPQLNVVPSDCETLLDIRTIPGQSHDELKEALARICDDVERSVTRSLREGFEHEVRERLRSGLSENLPYFAEAEVFEDRPWTQTSTDEPIVQAMADAARFVTDGEPVYCGVPGATDGTFLHAWRDIPIVTTGAGDKLVPHQRDEWVDMDQLVETAELYAAGALNFLNQNSPAKD